MATDPSPLGRLVKDYLFLLDKKETDLAKAIGISPNKMSAAIHARYRLRRDHVDRMVCVVAEWGFPLTDERYEELLQAWRSSVKAPHLAKPQASPHHDPLARMLVRYRGLRGAHDKLRSWRKWQSREDPRLLPGPLQKLVPVEPAESLYE